MPEHRFVKSVVITDEGLFLNGEHFPYYVTDDSMTIEPSTEQPEFIKILTLRVMIPVGEGWDDQLATVEDRRTPPAIQVAPAGADPNGTDWTDIGHLDDNGITKA